MKILNISVACEAGQIVLQFDEVKLKRQGNIRHILDMLTILEGVLKDTSLLSCMLELHDYFEPKEIAEQLQEFKLRPVEFSDSSMGESQIGECTSTKYTLPKDPVLTLAFLSTIKDYIRRARFDKCFVSELPISSYLAPEAEVIKLPLTKTISDIIDSSKLATNDNFHKESLWSVLVKKILKIKGQPYYDDTFAALTLTLSRSLKKDCEISIKNEFIPKTRFPSLHDRLIDLMSILVPLQSSNEIENHTNTVAQIMHIQKSLIKANKQQALNNLIDDRRLNAKLNFFQAKEFIFDNRYRPRESVTSAQFRLNVDRCIEAVVPDDSEPINRNGVLSDLRPVPMNNIASLIYLTEFLRLGIADSIDTNSVLFTRGVSKVLIQHGVHHTRPYLQKLLKMKNRATLFQQAVSHPFDNNNQPSYMYRVPRDVLNIIFAYASHDSGPILDPDELNAAKSIGWGRK